MYPKPIALTQQGPHKKTYLHYTQRCKTKQKTNWTRVSVKACHQINNLSHIFSSVQISRSVMFNSLQPHGLQHTRLPCPSSSPGACSNSCPSSQWCNPNSQSSVVPFSSSLQFFQPSGSFPMSQFFPSGGQSTGASVSASVLPMDIQDWFPLGLTGWISLRDSPRDSQESSPTPQFKSINSLALGLLYGPTPTPLHDY